jgi:hypothetical protein
MQDDFGTVNYKRGERSRELDVLRDHYRRHRETVMRLGADAPTEHLANEYQRLVRDIDAALAKLEEIEGRAAAPAAAATVAGAGAAASQRRSPQTAPHGDPLRSETQPGDRPLMPSPGEEADAPTEDYAPPSGAGLRLALILGAGLLVLGLIVWLIWSSSDRKTARTPIVEAPATVTEADTAPATIAPVTPAPQPAASPANVLAVRPALQDFGTIRKGTRATRQFEVTNGSDHAVAITVARSQCRCLYYEYKGTVQPRTKETVTVTVDGARAKAGTLDEVIAVTGTKDRSIAAQFQVHAEIH